VEEVRVNHFAYWHRWSDEEAALFAVGGVGGTAAWAVVLALAAARAWHAARRAQQQPDGHCKIDIGSGLLDAGSGGGKLAVPLLDADGSSSRSSCGSCAGSPSQLSRSSSGLSSVGSVLLSFRSESFSSSSRALSRTNSACSDRGSVAGAAAPVPATPPTAAARAAAPASPRLVPVVEETLLDALLLPSLAQELQRQQQQQQQPAPD
jgi:hypothetical protein